MLDHVFVWLSQLGTFGLVWILIALLLRRPALVVLVLAADGTADLLQAAIKAVVAVDRPPVRYPEPKALVHVPSDHSFPSGHAATSFACATVLAYAFPRLAAPFYLLAGAIAFSRVYVGVHYPVDVIGGAILGIAVAIALLRLVRVRRRSLRLRQPG